ncbi:hypothetical protein [Caloranaerobacter sp. DY30410]|uniref:hypothetical protein n=1 Tax=Caloranaerobacter sp. DY30410 TaxID=3238305 RepID=UPI003D04000D
MKTAVDKKINKSDFEFVQLDTEIHDQEFEGQAIGFFKDAMLRFVKNRSALVAAIIISIIVILAIFGPMMNKYTYREQHIEWAYLHQEFLALRRLVFVMVQK